MKVIVSKFGGTSLANSNHFLKVRDIIKSNEEQRRYVVASAPGKSNSEDTKVTDLLYLSYDLAKHNITYSDTLEKVFDKYREIAKGCKLTIDLEKHFKQIKADFEDLKSKDYIASRGEYLNAIILAELLGYDFVDAKDLIFFDENGNFDEERSYKAISKMAKEHKAAVIPGFYGQTNKGDIKTFSRGGGDLTGAIIARGVKTDLYENWTDVSGFLSADPRIVDNPKEIKVITYKELRELSYAGASVLHEEAIIPVAVAGIPIEIKNTFNPDEQGTLILPDTDEAPNSEITGVTGKKHFSVINIEKVQMNSDKSFHRKLMSVLEVNGITLEHMPTSIDSISLIVADKYLTGIQETLISEIKTFCNPDKITIDSGISLITVVGRGMKNHVGVSAKLFKSLADANVNIQMIIQGSSELNIIVGVDEKDYEKSIKSIYDAFLG
ncbi:aspartate kinase [Anaerosphaera multitolerans]|uniref:Aspartokinase n=1 Tax=Anaerosphaera multitolerans TaxID=2487351 RepID=A0A437S7I2_9FIRM|nr:aspartate kinase [Anaerosphaera multitolerans]RVU55039.1 aspartate kinase [Anaerosphaera multitolerans]